MPENTGYRWYILALATLTMGLAVAVPSMCMSVLFDEISADLGLSLGQVGLIWGISALPGIVAVLIGGALGDRFGPKRMLIGASLLAGAAGALRGLSTNFATLAAASVLFGLGSTMIPVNTFKTCGIWFPRRQLGLASGVVSMGMALGFMLSSLISATLLSPWLGGWRWVLVLYGSMAMCLALPWALTRPAPAAADQPATLPRQSLRETLAHIGRIGKMWRMGWAILGIGGCVQGTLGYLPLYLRDSGWPEARADSVAASFHLASLLFVIPIALRSDKIGSRKRLLLAAALMIMMGVGLLSVVEGALVWMAVVMAGMVRDGFMALFMTMVIETRGVGAAFAATATAFVMVFSNTGGLLAPPIGNSLAALAPSLPFVFWAGLALAGYMALHSAQEERIEPVPAAQPAG